MITCEKKDYDVELAYPTSFHQKVSIALPNTPFIIKDSVAIANDYFEYKFSFGANEKHVLSLNYYYNVKKSLIPAAAYPKVCAEFNNIFNMIAYSVRVAEQEDFSIEAFINETVKVGLQMKKREKKNK